MYNINLFSKIAQALSNNTNVFVKIQGDEVYSSYDDDNKVFIITLPDNSLQNTNYILYNAYLEHEIGEIRYTTFDIFKVIRKFIIELYLKYKGKGSSKKDHQFTDTGLGHLNIYKSDNVLEIVKFIGLLINIVNDYRIEYLLKKKFPGTKFTLTYANKYVVNNVVNTATKILYCINSEKINMLVFLNVWYFLQPSLFDNTNINIVLNILNSKFGGLLFGKDIKYEFLINKWLKTEDKTAGTCLSANITGLVLKHIISHLKYPNAVQELFYSIADFLIILSADEMNKIKKKKLPNLGKSLRLGLTDNIKPEGIYEHLLNSKSPTKTNTALIDIMVKKQIYHPKFADIYSGHITASQVFNSASLSNKEIKNIPPPIDETTSNLVENTFFNLYKELQIKHRTPLPKITEKGKLYQNRLYRLSLDKKDVYKKYSYKDKINTAVCILIDNSGSILGNPRIEKIIYSVLRGMAKGLEFMYRCKYRISTYFTTSWQLGYNVKNGLPLEKKVSNEEFDRIMKLSTIDTNYIDDSCKLNVILKDYDEPAYHYFENEKILTNCLLFDRCNADPYHLDIEAKDILKRKEKNKIIIVLSDAFPNSRPIFKPATPISYTSLLEKIYNEYVSYYTKRGVKICNIAFVERYMFTNMMNTRAIFIDRKSPAEISKEIINILQELLN